MAIINVRSMQVTLSDWEHSMALLSYSIASGIPVTLTNAEISIIRTTNIHILMNLMIKMINLIDMIPYMTVMTVITWHPSMPLEFHWQLSNWVGLLCICCSCCILCGEAWSNYSYSHVLIKRTVRLAFRAKKIFYVRYV